MVIPYPSDCPYPLISTTVSYLSHLNLYEYVYLSLFVGYINAIWLLFKYIDIFEVSTNLLLAA